MILAQEPKITITITCDKSQVIKTTLSLNETGFCCEIQGANKTLEKQLLNWLEAYANRASLPTLQLLAGMQLPLYTKKVLRHMQTIPYGQTASYQELATLSGNPLASRAVGNVCNRNPFPLFIPCHRIIQKGGAIGGFALDLTIKSRLLAFESQ